MRLLYIATILITFQGEKPKLKIAIEFLIWCTIIVLAVTSMAIEQQTRELIVEIKMAKPALPEKKPDERAVPDFPTTLPIKEPNPAEPARVNPVPAVPIQVPVRVPVPAGS